MLHFPKWKVILVLGVVLAGFIFALPNAVLARDHGRRADLAAAQQVNLGLDLQGGAHLLYQLDENEMIEDWLNSFRDDVRETLAQASASPTRTCARTTRHAPSPSRSARAGTSRRPSPS